MTIDQEDAPRFVAALNDLRLYVSEDTSGTERAQENRQLLMDWLAVCQDSLLEAMLD